MNNKPYLHGVAHSEIELREVTEKPPPSITDLLAMPLSDEFFKLSSSTINRLNVERIYTPAQLLLFDLNDEDKFRLFSKHSLQELSALIEKYKFRTVSTW